MIISDSHETTRPPLYDGPCNTTISNSHSTVVYERAPEEQLKTSNFLKFIELVFDAARLMR